MEIDLRPEDLGKRAEGTVNLESRCHISPVLIISAHLFAPLLGPPASQGANSLFFSSGRQYMARMVMGCVVMIIKLVFESSADPLRLRSLLSPLW